MKNVKRAIALFLTMLMIVTFAACTARDTDSADGSTPPDGAEKATEVKVIDVLGREVILDKPATKIVSVHVPTANAAVVLGGGQKYLVGFGPKGMAQGLYSAVMDDFDGLPQVGAGGMINLESTIATGADLAIIPGRFKEQIEEFENIGIPTIVIIPSKESLNAVKDTLTILGKAIGEEERASKINEFFDKKIANARSISSKAATKQKVLFLGKRSPLSVAHSAMIQTELIETAGGENAVSGIDKEEGFVDVSLEQIIMWDPEVIWLPPYVDYTIESLLNDPAWSNINAIKNKRIAICPASDFEPWDQPTAAVALGICWATYNLHPDLYTLDDLKKDADEFYNLIYG
ncbi:MAG TPA: ABC transporter substrate-binding protein, partial [Anaerovoracaceae bacterium]|nr:ABC transporter substrate-binding protein [Anaerovoracaceae bacterium]